MSFKVFERFDSDRIIDVCIKQKWAEARAMIAKNPLLLCVTDDETGITVAHCVVRNAGVKMLKCILNAVLSLPGCDEQMLRDAFEKKDLLDRTPAHLAARNDNPKHLALLVKYCPSGTAILEAADYHGDTPAHYACYNPCRMSNLEYIAKNAPSGTDIFTMRSFRGKKFTDLSEPILEAYFTPEKIREIQSARELKLLEQCDTFSTNSFISLVVKIIGAELINVYK